MTEDIKQADKVSSQVDTDKDIALDFTQLQGSTLRQIQSYMDTDVYIRKYSRKQIENFLDNPQRYEKQIREVSLNLASTSNYYMRLMLYMSRMLTLDYIITPVNIQKKDLSKKAFKTNYDKVVHYMDTFNVKHEIGKALIAMSIEDTFFGYERRVKDSSMIQKLPADYCKITGMEDGLYTFSFDMRYFERKKSRLRNYPSDFFKLYKKYLETNQYWQPLDTDYAVCLKFREDLSYSVPPFTSVFEDILDHQDLKILAKSKNKLENFKLLLQKIPFKKEPRSENDFLIGLDSVKMFHDNIKTVLPEQIGLISSPMEIEDYSFEKRNNAIKNSLEDSQESIFNSAGVSSGMFNAGSKSSIALGKSTQTDEAVMFGILRQLERFFNKRLAQITTSTYRFKVMFPDLTVYNRSEMLDKYLKMSQFGFPKSLVASALGMTTTELVGLNTLENEYLDLDEKLTPLSSSHTQTNDDVKEKAKKDDNDLTDKGLETRDGEVNIKKDDK